MPADILIVDDEADIRDLVAGILEDEGHNARLARDSDEALRAIEERRPHLVILDIWLQGSRLDGLEVLSYIKRSYPELPVVIISGHGNIETAVTAIKRGAYDYIEKPFKADRLILVTLRALEAFQLKREVKELRERSSFSADMIGKSSAINQLRNAIDRVAPTNSRILIRGPSGSGKELAARVIHMKSSRAEAPFVVLNAAAMAPDRVEEELFGTEDRTGGPRKVGALEEAHGGTLYIDEVADMPMETQGKVLRVLVEQKFLRIGGTQKVAVDVRIISSTSRDLEREISEGRFREDLYHRLNVVPLRVPSLAERREDIPELIQYFVGPAQQRLGPGAAAHRRGRDRGAAGARLAGQRARAQEQHRAPDDPRRRRPQRRHHRRHAARRDRLQRAAPGQRRRRAPDVAAAARGARDLRARVSAGADQPLRRQHLAHGRVRRHGALGPAPQAEGAGRLLGASRRRDPPGLEPTRPAVASAGGSVSRIVYVNGRYLPYAQAAVHAEDRGFQFADAIYEVCQVRGGRLVDEARHMARLAARSPSSDPAADERGRARPRHARDDQAQPGQGRDRLPASHPRRGPARVRLSRPRTCRAPWSASRGRGARPHAALAEQGIAVKTMPDIRWGRCDIKTVMLLPACLAKEAARGEGAREAWLVDKDGFVTEGASSNAWIVSGEGTVITRPIAPDILAGVTRATLFDVLREEKVPFLERPFRVAEALAAREAFITSATNTVMPVVRIDGTPIGDGSPGPITRRLRSKFHQFAAISCA